MFSLIICINGTLAALILPRPQLWYLAMLIVNCMMEAHNTKLAMTVSYACTDCVFLILIFS
jgi:hypothetical protein